MIKGKSSGNFVVGVLKREQYWQPAKNELFINYLEFQATYLLYPAMILQPQNY